MQNKSDNDEPQKISSMKSGGRAVLNPGKSIVYESCQELKDRIDIPYRVVISEYVELAKTFGAEDGHKYVNGVLDKLALTLRPLETSSERV